jgi:hypothetical protein
VTEDDREPSEQASEERSSAGDETATIGTDTTSQLPSPDWSGQRRRRATTVVLAVPDSLTRTTPARRLLQGRIDSRFCLYPCYLLLFAAGICAVTFTAHSNHWVAAPVALAWCCLIMWYWLYNIAYRYRRRFFRLICSTSIWTTSAGLCILASDRARAQIESSSQQGLQEAAATGLVWAWILTLIAALILVSHVLFFGRGYREKTGTFQADASMTGEGDWCDD